MYIIAAITLFTLGSCQQKDKATSESDGYAMDDTTQVAEETVVTDTASATADSDVKVPDTISVKTTRINTDETAGKFALANTKWKLVELMGKKVDNTTGKDYLLTMNSKTGKFSSYVGCNNIMGSYLMKEANTITFLYVGATKMACPDMDFESKYMAMLPRIDNYMIEGNMLHLHKGKRNAFAKFEAIQ